MHYFFSKLVLSNKKSSNNAKLNDLMQESNNT